MFFVAAKLAWFVLQPSTALVLLLVAGIAAIAFGRVRGGAIAAMLAALGLVVAGILPLGVLLMLPLEDRFPRAAPDGPIAGIVVLGGGIDQAIGAARGTTALTEAGDRVERGGRAGAALSRRKDRLHRRHRQPDPGRAHGRRRGPAMFHRHGHSRPRG